MALTIHAFIFTRTNSPYLFHTKRAVEQSNLKPETVNIVNVDDENYATLGQAVNAEIAKLDKPVSPTTLYWIVHEDSAPEPDALYELSRALDTSPTLGAAGPKQIAWEDSSKLLEVGIRATRTARRVPEVDVDDRDGGQLDNRSDVLGVGSAGMLIRSTAFEAVGGMNEHLGPFGDGLEFCRRLHYAGWRVVVVPQAKVRHARASLGESGRGSFAKRRRAQIYNALLVAPSAFVPFIFLGYLLLTPLRALARLCTKELALADGEIRGGFGILADIPAIIRGKRLISEAKKNADTQVRASAIRELEARGKDVRVGKRDLARTAREKIQLANRPHPLEEKEKKLWVTATRKARLLILGFVLLCMLLATARLWGSTAVSGGALLPDNQTGWQVLRSAISGWLAVGDGSVGRLDALWILFSPFALLLQPFGITMGTIATATLYLCLPFSALTAFWAARSFTASPQVRSVATLTWVAAPPLLVAISYGHVAGALFHTCLPLALAIIVTMWRYPLRRNFTNVGSVALLGAVMSACAPVTLLLLVLTAATGFIISKNFWWLWLPIPAAVLVVPSLAFDWRLIFSTPGAPTNATPTPYSLFVFNPAGSATNPFALMAGSLGSKCLTLFAVIFLAVAVLALVRGRNWKLIRASWLGVSAGMIWAVACTHVAVALYYDGAQASYSTAWAGIGLSVSMVGLWSAIVAGADGLRTDMSGRAFGLFQLISLGTIATLLFGATTTSLAWAVAHAKGESVVGPVKNNAVPLSAILDQKSSAHTRVLALFPTEHGIRGEIWRGDGRRLTDVTMADSSALLVGAQHGVVTKADADMQRIIANLANAHPTIAQDLVHHGIGYVVIPGVVDQPKDNNTATTTTPNPESAQHATAQLASSLNAAGHLTFINSTESGMFWRVGNGRIARATLNSHALPSGKYGLQTRVQEAGTLSLAERRHNGWVAYLDGVALEKTGSSWNEEWKVPSAGNLVISYSPLTDYLVAGTQLVVALAAIVVALPLRRRKVVTH